jgi:hypothetical protein
LRTLIRGDGYVEFSASETDTVRIIGLESHRSHHARDDIDFGVYLSNDGTPTPMNPARCARRRRT